MLVIKQYIQRRNLFKKANKHDMQDYDSNHKKIYKQSPVTTTLEKSSSGNLSEKKKNNQRINDKKIHQISKSSSNIYMPTNEQSSEQEIRTPMLSNYDKLSNSSFINPHNGLNLSHANLYSNFNNQNNEQDNFEQFDGFKLITRNGSTKIVNGQNDDISEYEIPIIRYSDRPALNQYSNNFMN